LNPKQSVISEAGPSESKHMSSNLAITHTTGHNQHRFCNCKFSPDTMPSMSAVTSMPPRLTNTAVARTRKPPYSTASPANVQSIPTPCIAFTQPIFSVSNHSPIIEFRGSRSAAMLDFIKLVMTPADGRRVLEDPQEETALPLSHSPPKVSDMPHFIAVLD
jgi:hypothetical protein